MQTSDGQKKPQIVVLVSGSGSNLQAIIEHIQAGQIDAEIALVISNVPGVLGLARAEKANIETTVIAHQQYNSRDSFERDLIHCIDDVQPQLLVLAGFMRVLSPSFCHKYRAQMLNIHPSLLPQFKGMHTHQQALDAGVHEHGASAHFVTEQLDGGPIIIQAVVSIQQQDTVYSLANKVLQLEHIIFPIAIKWFCEGRLQCQGQQALLDKKILPEQGITYRHQD